jgi:hypothetical protein
MNEIKAMPYYKDGERSGPLCNEPLAAHQVLPEHVTGTALAMRANGCCSPETVMAGITSRLVHAGAMSKDAQTLYLRAATPALHSKPAAPVVSMPAQNAGLPARMCSCGCGQCVSKPRKSCAT